MAIRHNSTGVLERFRGGVLLSMALSSLICLFSCQESNMKTTASPPPDSPRTTATPAAPREQPRSLTLAQPQPQPPFMVEPDSNSPEIRVAILKDVRTLKIGAGSADAVVLNSAGQEV